MIHSTQHYLDATGTDDAPVFLRFPSALERLIEQPPEAKAEITLREAFESNLLRKVESKTAKTFQGYTTALAHWERLTDNPTLGRIARDPDLLLAFQSALKDEAGPDGKPLRGAETVNKVFRSIKPIIASCFPPERKNPSAKNLIPFIEFPEDVSGTKRLPRVATIAELESLYEACSVATWPRRQPRPAAEQWRTMIVLMRCCGPRVYDLSSLLRTNDETTNGVCIDWDDDWKFMALTFTATKTKKLQRIPLGPTAHAHLERQLIDGREQVFHGNWQYSNTSTHLRQWRNICEAAGLNRKLHLEDLRHTCSTNLNRIWPGVGAWVLGHEAQGVNAKNYHDPTQEIFDAITIDDARLPESWRNILK